MQYPLISEYRDAILSAEDNFKELSSLRPVLDRNRDPVMSSGNFAVIFKMRDKKDGKLYAVKCFIKEQERRNESYIKIADELEYMTSSYIVPIRYLEEELFVDSEQCDSEEFPVVLMDWVEGQTLSNYIEQHIDSRYDLEMLSYRFNCMAAWLQTQPFAHGDLKPDNILVREDGSLVLVDYDGMFVSSMKGEPAREIGSPDYRHPLRTYKDFDENIDDFSIAVISLSLRAIALSPELLSHRLAKDVLLLTVSDFLDPSASIILKEIHGTIVDSTSLSLLGAFYIALGKGNLAQLSSCLFLTEKPEARQFYESDVCKSPITEILSTEVTEEDLEEGIKDEFGVTYSKDGKRLLKCPSKWGVVDYNVRFGTKVICDSAFKPDIDEYGEWPKLKSINIPESVTGIGEDAFSGCIMLESIHLPVSLTTLGDSAFYSCSLLKNINLSNSVTIIGDYTFSDCKSLESIHIPDSVRMICYAAFEGCKSLKSIHLSDSVTEICDFAFGDCESLKNIYIPNSVTKIGKGTFVDCKSLGSVLIPDSVTEIGEGAFYRCGSLRHVNLPDSLSVCVSKVFPPKCKVTHRIQ